MFEENPQASPEAKAALETHLGTVKNQLKQRELSVLVLHADCTNGDHRVKGVSMPSNCAGHSHGHLFSVSSETGPFRIVVDCGSTHWRR
jgi:hypothetical protein